jgi:hypothetical protein
MGSLSPLCVRRVTVRKTALWFFRRSSIRSTAWILWRRPNVCPPGRDVKTGRKIRLSRGDEVQCEPSCHRWSAMCNRVATSNLLEDFTNFRSWRDAESSICIQEGGPPSFSGTWQISPFKKRRHKRFGGKLALDNVTNCLARCLSGPQTSDSFEPRRAAEWCCRSVRSLIGQQSEFKRALNGLICGGDCCGGSQSLMVLEQSRLFQSGDSANIRGADTSEQQP